MIDPPFQWQVVQAELDPIRGSEQAGTRPVLIVSNEAINESLPIVTVLPLTTRREGRRVYSTEVLLPSRKAGQPQESIVLVHQIRTLSKDRLRRSYGWLEDEVLRRQVCIAMKVHLDME